MIVTALGEVSAVDCLNVSAQMKRSTNDAHGVYAQYDLEEQTARISFLTQSMRQDWCERNSPCQTARRSDFTLSRNKSMDSEALDRGDSNDSDYYYCASYIMDR